MAEVSRRGIIEKEMKRQLGESLPKVKVGKHREKGTGGGGRRDE